MDWDEGPEVGGPYGPYFQSQRADRYTAGRRRRWSPRATPTATTAPRPSAPPTARRPRSRTRSPTGSARSRSPTPTAPGSRPRAGPTPSGSAVPPGRTVVVRDLIKGDVEQKTDEIGDFVIVRPDGTPLYNFASVVDDAEMKITHVVRAEEHLANTFSQVLVFEALGRDAAGVRPRPVRGRAGLEEEALEAEELREARHLRLPARVSSRRATCPRR